MFNVSCPHFVSKNKIKTNHYIFISRPFKLYLKLYRYLVINAKTELYKYRFLIQDKDCRHKFIK